MIDKTRFTEAYERLNPEQKKAVDTIHGPVMVIAGPGTGKTQILTLRIANILLITDTEPESILAITFTEAGVKAMRDRLTQYIGPEAYRITITTFHSFATQLIRTYPESYPEVIGGRPATDIDVINIIERILDDGSVPALRPGGNPAYYVPKIRSIIGDLKLEYITPDKLAELIEQQERALDDIEQYHQKGAHKGKERGEYKEAVKHLARNQALVQVYRLYEAALRAERLYDFNDMISLTVRALESDESLRQDLQERYQYVLADEHQDVNGAQNNILLQLTNYDSPNIFVVGDEKQAIYRFQGASLENFLLFESHYHNTTVISLVDNYRSGQTILDAAHSLVAMDEGPLATLRLPLTACVVPDSHIRLTEYDHQAQEMNALTELIQDRIAAGVPAREIAVILTRNVDVEDVTRSLRAAGLAAVPSADSDILQHPVLRTIESLLRAAVLRDERALFDQLHAPYWGHASSDLVRLAGWRKSNQSLLHVIEQAVQAEPCDLQKPESLTNMLEVFRGASVRSLTDTPHAVLAWLLKKSGCIAMMMRNAPYDTTRVVRRVYDEIEGLVRRDGLETVEDVLGTLGARRAYGLPLVAPYVATDTDAVQVMTAHKSKGLEFDMVCLPRLSDANWGQDTARQVFKIPLHRHSAETTEDAAADDKKRLLYVALTRARKELHLSYANNNADGRPLTQSRLLSDIDETLIDRQTDHRPVDVLAGINAPTRRSLVDVPAATALFKERGFSATGLNNFLQSPYEYYFKNLLRIPEVQPDYLLYGTAVHSVLETFVRRGQAGEDARMTDHDVLQKIKQTLSALPLSATEYATRHEQALAALVPYTDHLRHTLPVKSRLEYSVRAIITVAGFDIPLVGNIDRLDFDESGQVTGIVDYKTGKVKSRRVIEGTNRDYKRQLLFYVYLLQQQPDSRLHTNTVTLAFVESAATGDIKEETFVISDQELQEFEVELRAAVAQMLSGEWAETPCTEADCEYWYLLQPITES